MSVSNFNYVLRIVSHSNINNAAVSARVLRAFITSHIIPSHATLSDDLPAAIKMLFFNKSKLYDGKLKNNYYTQLTLCWQKGSDLVEFDFKTGKSYDWSVNKWLMDININGLFIQNYC